MATTMKRETLKSIGNVPDWVLKQSRTKDGKKEATPTKKEVIRPKTTKPKVVAPTVSTPSPVAITKPPVIPQPIKEEVKDPRDNGIQTPAAGARVRRIYSREFLIKFKYSAPAFPPGTLTPLDLIAQYNKEFEQRERLASQDNSSLKPTPSTHNTPAHPQQTESTPAAAGEKKKLLKKKEGEKTEGTKKKVQETFKLRLGNTDESILRSPLFRASATASTTTKTPSRHATPTSSKVVVPEDKENTLNSAKAARPSSVTKVRVAPKKKDTPAAPVPVSTTHITITTPALISSPTPAVTPAPATPAPTPAPQPASEDVVMHEEPKPDELVDALTKKLKGVLKETDARRLAQRQKQIDYGKATLGYQDYTKQVAKSKRKREDPKTPNKYQVCSKRSWDGQVRKWRRMLHFYDPADIKDGVIEALDSKHFEITEADLLAEENALRE